MIVVGLLTIAWWLTAIVAWFAILFTGRYPQGLYQFGVGVLRWFIRVESYLLLLVDESRRSHSSIGELTAWRIGDYRTDTPAPMTSSVVLGLPRAPAKNGVPGLIA